MRTRKWFRSILSRAPFLSLLLSLALWREAGAPYHFVLTFYNSEHRRERGRRMKEITGDGERLPQVRRYIFYDSESFRIIHDFSARIGEAPGIF